VTKYKSHAARCRVYFIDGYMNLFPLLLLFSLLVQAPASNQPPEKSSYFAFVDHEYIFTIELVKPGVPLLNFVSMTDQENNIPAKNIRLSLENRKVAAKSFTIETGDRPMAVFSTTVHPRSSFGFRLNGEFGDAKELFGATIQMGTEEFKLVPLRSFDFETLAIKVNRINLGSPDFGGDWRVLQLETLGTRTPARK
jgi:hypothetical protein